MRETFWHLGTRFGGFPGPAPPPPPQHGDGIGKYRHPILGPSSLSVASPPSVAGLGARVTVWPGPAYDVLTGAEATREAMLQDPLFLPGTLARPPDEVVWWAYAERISLSVSWETLTVARPGVQVYTSWQHLTGDIGGEEDPNTVDDGDGHPRRPDGWPAARPWPPHKVHRYEADDELGAPSRTSALPTVDDLALAPPPAVAAGFPAHVVTRAGVREAREDGEGSSWSEGEPLPVTFPQPPPEHVDFDTYMHTIYGGRSLRVADTGAPVYFALYRVWAMPIVVEAEWSGSHTYGSVSLGSWGWILDFPGSPNAEALTEAISSWEVSTDSGPPPVRRSRPVGYSRYRTTPGPIDLPPAVTWGGPPTVSAQVERMAARR